MGFFNFELGAEPRGMNPLEFSLKGNHQLKLCREVIPTCFAVEKQQVK